MNFLFSRRAVCVGPVLVFGLVAFTSALSQQVTEAPAKQGASGFPCPEKLTYRIEWHSVAAGTAIVQLSKSAPSNWQFDLNLQSAGLVTRLYRVLDTYKSVTTSHFCTLSTSLDAQEGKRHRQAQLTFQPAQHKVNYYEHDLVKNTTERKALDIAPCTHDVVASLATLRALNLQPGKTAMLPVTDGKKMVNARVDAQAKENVTVGGKTYSAIRYEAFLFDNVLYKRKGRLFIWTTDDADRLPVQLRVQLGFPIGTVTLELDKQEKM
ncbi:MAG TPA: DUF3108 domain-containing protein [Bryobacteraceae bacterium]